MFEVLVIPLTFQSESEIYQKCYYLTALAELFYILVKVAKSQNGKRYTFKRLKKPLKSPTLHQVVIL